VEKRCGDTVLNCNERLGHCSSLQWWPTAMQWGCLGQGIALQYNAMKPLPLRLLCSRLRTPALGTHPDRPLQPRIWASPYFLVCSRWAARRLDSPLPGSCGAPPHRDGSAAGDSLAKVARPLYTVPYAMIAPSGTQLWHASRRRFLSAIAVPTS